MLINDKRQNEDDAVLALDYDMSRPEDRRAYRLHQLIDQFPGNGNRGCFIDPLVVSKPTHEMVIRLADSLLDLKEVARPDQNEPTQAPSKLPYWWGSPVGCKLSPGAPAPGHIS